MKKTLTALTLAALLAGCASGDPDGEGANVVQNDDNTATEAETSAPEEPAEETPTEDAQGTRSNPLSVGAAARIGDWEVTLTDVNEDAADIVAEENEFNDPPGDGEQMVMVTIEATYVGEDSGTVFGDFIYRIVGAGGNTFEERCGVIPNPVEDTGETFTDATVSGNFCWRVAADQIDGGTFMMEAFTFAETERTFWSLQ